MSKSVDEVLIIINTVIIVNFVALFTDLPQSQTLACDGGRKAILSQKVHSECGECVVYSELK